VASLGRPDLRAHSDIAHTCGPQERIGLNLRPVHVAKRSSRKEEDVVRLPLRLRLFGLVYGRWSTPISQTRPEDVPALRERQRRTYGLRAARIVMGRHAEGVEVENTLAVDAEGEPLPVRIYRPPTAARSPLPA